MSSLQPSKILSVSELTNIISGLIENNLDYLWLEGEVSNLRIPASGHCYFTLKDSNSQIRAVLFKRSRQSIPFDLKDGQKLICLGNLNVYAARGEYQIIVEKVEAAGLGSLHLAFEQLKKRLAEEGLFDENNKNKIPLHPEKIGVVTSATGAALRDILKIFEGKRLKPDILIAPVRVQGEGAASDISEAIGALDRLNDIDLIVVSRGGGAIEDLWSFNEEKVARSIYCSKTPVISAVGHETDICISDLVADLRSATPSIAAETISSGMSRLAEDINSMEARLTAATKSIISSCRNRLRGTTNRLKSPEKTLNDLRIELDELSWKLKSSTENKLKDLRSALSLMTGKLNSLSPLAVLARGYSIATSIRDGRIIKSAEDINKGDSLSLRLNKGSLICIVGEKPADL
ncbi:MAG: exodeoxyribonuclease VII large subunit [Proteobacteria bacterium]|nr:exodeoxyribonuclease VII large subunit [Pseudomonadota bacterium]